MNFTPEESNGERKTSIKGGVTGLREKGSKDTTQHLGRHVHERDDVTDPLGKGTGGQYNPEEVEHDLPEKEEKMKKMKGHAGDLGSLEPDENVVANLDHVVHTNTIDIKGRP